jgi:hypothetical protein
MPTAANGAMGTDGELIVVDGDIVYNFWKFNRTSASTATASAYGESNVVTGSGWGTRSPFLSAGITAAGSSELGGLLIQAETDTGTINHALQLVVDRSLVKSGATGDAIASDGGSATGIVHEGDHLAISPSTPMPSGLSALGQEVFRALQQYGAYVVDTSTSGGASIRVQANAYDSTTINALSHDMGSMAPLLEAVSGGTPAAPSAPTTPTTPTVTPAVTQATASPGTGIEHAGDTITLSLGFNKAMTVTGTPTLSLNDGNKATYAGGSGTSTLTFKTTVAATDTNTSALAITGVNLPSGASIKDASGVAANLSGAVKTFSGLQIDPISPAVTQATASPGTGTEHVGDAITLTLGFNEAVTVSGTPTLSLNDGGTATYVSGSGTGTLTFKTTVASTDTNVSSLAITGVNLPSGASIRDSSGAAANLSGAVKTFTGLQIDPLTSPTTPASGGGTTTPSSTKPGLTIADHSLSVAGRGGTVDLGTKVTTSDSDDAVTVNITGLPRYGTITDKLDGHTFRGSNITLTAAQVDSGLELHSYYRGGGHPTATLTVTASAKDPTTGAFSTASPQTITVMDPRPATTTTSHTHARAHTCTHTLHASTVTDHPAATTTAPTTPTTTAATTTTSPRTIDFTDLQHAITDNTGSLASRAFALLQQHIDPATSTLATTGREPIFVADHPVAAGATTASLASQSFALLNQYLAGNTGRADPGQIVAATSQATGWGQDSLLARPH